MSNRPVWMEPPSLPMRLVKGITLTLITAVMLYPFVYVVSVSLSGVELLRHGSLVLWPRDVTLSAYRTIFGGDIVLRALVVSVGVTVVGTIFSMVMTVTLAYGLTRTRDVPGSRFVLYLALFTMLFGAGLIPNFLLVKYLGLLDSYASLIIPSAVSAFNLVVVRNFFMGLPQELYDSARIDGASEFRILGAIVLPLSKAVLAVIALFYGVGYWNSFFNAVLYLNDTRKYPVQLILNTYVVQGTPLSGVQGTVDYAQVAPQGIKMAVLVVGTLPILLVYPFLQRYFTKGVLTGAIKH